MDQSYSEFFRALTGNGILPYQRKYGEDPFVDTLLVIPTGLGKTHAVIVPWLYARKHKNNAPTRCIVVLPRQNLTAQTADVARGLVKQADMERNVEVLELMGGRDKDNDRKLAPDRAAVIVCTQDMYFSRALNRGYARRPKHWPIDFALYNQDCLIVLDEVQLMEDALATSTQLAAFRRRFGIYGSARCVWMSATVKPEWLRTVDFDGQPREIRLGDDDLTNEVVNERIHAKKIARPAPAQCGTPGDCASFVLAQHKPKTRSLVIANTVARAREIARAIRKAEKLSAENVLLVHSRFRPQERQALAARLTPGQLPAEGQIVVATQVLEAGVDITSRLLVTDVAPWGSLVQRFGRVNRIGKDEGAEIWWVAEPTYSKQKDAYAPYTKEEITAARLKLDETRSAAPADLKPEDGDEPWHNVLRKADLLDLFDTSPDLGGNDLDVSRFIRSAEERDVYLAWRNWKADELPPNSGSDLEDAELCPVPLGELRDFANRNAVYWWSFAEDKWQRLDKQRAPFPGMLLLTRCEAGGYTTDEGWAPESKANVLVAVAAAGKEEPLEGDSSNALSFGEYRQTLLAHTERVVEEMENLLTVVALDAESVEALRVAARKHDWGKAHPVFQKTLRAENVLLAKQCGRGQHERPHFRHEVASALAMVDEGNSDKAVYVAAAHHGHVRMSIRSMPGEREEGGKRVARGIHEGDRLNSAELMKGQFKAERELSLKLMEFGGDGERDSWTARMLRLLEEMGPFRLAYLEMLLRAADGRASEEPGKDREECPA